MQTEVTKNSLRLKDAQIALLSEQNTKLTENLSHAQVEEKNAVERRIVMEEQLEALKQELYEMKNEKKIERTRLENLARKHKDMEVQSEILKKQNSELVKLLDENEESRDEFKLHSENYKRKITRLERENSELEQKAAASHEKLLDDNKKLGLVTNELRLMQLKLEEMKVLQKESEDKVKVELECLQEQLLLKKQKQVELLEQIHLAQTDKANLEASADALKIQLKDISTRYLGMKETLEDHKKQLKLTENIHLESVKKEDTLKNSNEKIFFELQEAKKSCLKIEQERNDNADQVKKLAQRVFELVERLKLAEVSKAKALQLVKEVEGKFDQSEQKQQRLLSKITSESRRAVGFALENKALKEQVESLKKQCAQLGAKSKSQTSKILKCADELEEVKRKNVNLSERTTYLLQKLALTEQEKLGSQARLEESEENEKKLQDNKIKLEEDVHNLERSKELISKALHIKKTDCELLQVELNAMKKRILEFNLLKSENVEATNKRSSNTSNGGETQKESLKSFKKIDRKNVESRKRAREVVEQKQKILISFLSFAFSRSKKKSHEETIALRDLDLGEDECHVISSMFKTNIEDGHYKLKVDLQRNKIDDSSLRALQVIYEPRANKDKFPVPSLLDLRRNLITEKGITKLAQAINRLKFVQHVYIHKGGKIEAFGTSIENDKVTVNTLFVIDCTENKINSETLCRISLGKVEQTKNQERVKKTTQKGKSITTKRKNVSLKQMVDNTFDVELKE
eukprot:snap_masked-scaffold_2-processed-gene-18.42-mRNA-1 protein AED:1.00 eAED:1.00 QI:0/-1/0/0/-1/1/1/0/747